MPDLTPPANEANNNPNESNLNNLLPEPQPIEPEKSWEHYELYQAVKKAIFALPSFFKTELFISGVLATDLFTFNTSLGATIETQVVAALNEMRSAWDSEQKYSLYSFVRQAQRFPDVILRAANTDVQPAIIMGIELKGWYILAKEREPSFRYRVTPNVCTPADLLVVFPWALSNVISGSPQLFQPYVTSAYYAAAYRNWHWQYKKAGGAKNEIILSKVATPYPTKGDMIADIPKSDNGKNFGRFARTGLMDQYMSAVFHEQLSGIPLFAWQKFLSLFSEEQPEDIILLALDRMARETRATQKQLSNQTIEAIKNRIAEIVELLNKE